MCDHITDPDVRIDLCHIVDRLVPQQDQYRHIEGNTAAHMKSSPTGHSVQLIIEDGMLQLGSWQGVFFWEFDGPRNRHLYIQIHHQ